MSIISEDDDMITICAWCPDMDKIDTKGKKTSHGICKKCSEKF